MRKSGSTPPARRWQAARLLSIACAALFGGCAAPSATLDLISVARKGLSSARQDAEANHADNIRQLEAQKADLDAAFDADVKLAAAGKLTSADGEPAALSAEWVISARKGYSAARDLIGAQIGSSNSAHQTALDNLDAAAEALDMACELIVSQQNLSQQLKRYVLETQRSAANER